VVSRSAAAGIADGVNFFQREPVCLIRFKRSDGPSSIQYAIAQVDSQSVLDHLGIAFANGPDRLLASTSNQLLVEPKVDLPSCHDPRCG
jgi:hypothetical protein